jgi:hypothetical protein
VKGAFLLQTKSGNAKVKRFSRWGKGGIMTKNLLCFFFIFSPLLGLRPSPAQAFLATSENACSPLDFRNSFPLLMRDQGKTSWCYANAAADYLQYTFQIPEQISAADIAINYSQTDLSQLIQFFESIFSKKARLAPAQTGIIKYAIEAALPQGYCSETNLPSEQWTKVFHDQTSQKVEIITAIHDLYQLQKQVRKGSITQESDLPYSYSFPQINRAQFFSLLQTSNHRRLLINLRATACAGVRKPFPQQSVSAHFHLRTKKIFEHINASFDQQQPVTVDFSKDAFRNLDHFNPFDWHTVLLYGRKFDSTFHECVYLMKNSHGPSCVPGGVPYDPRLNCDGGYVWFPESALYRAMTSELTLQKN